MLPRKNIMLLPLLLLLSLPLWSQQPEPYAFTHYSIADGLASNIVNNVTQDHKGYIWLATINGLQRFDGNKFITFKNEAARPGTLPSDEVALVYEDKNQNLWVATNDNKVGMFNTQTFRYTEVPVTPWQKDNVYVNKSFIETGDGTLLLHLRKTNKLFQYSAARHAFVPSTLIPFPENWKVNFITKDKITQKFLLASDSGFAVYNPVTRNLSYRNHNTENEPLISSYGNERFINYVYIDSARQLFFEQWIKSAVHPLFKVFDLKTNTKKEYNLRQQYQLGYHEINAMLEQRNGKLWVFGLPFLAEYTNGSSPFQFLKKDYNKEKDLKFTKVFSMYEDRQRNVWVCTDYGIYLCNPDAQLFHNYTLTNPKRHTVEGRVQTAIQLPNGDIWIGYRDLGLYRYDKNLNPLPIPASIVPFQNMKSVWDIHQHSKTGAIWLALQGGKLIVYDTATHKAKLLAPPAFEQRAITQITEDTSGNLWLGTQPGNIVKWDYKAAATNIDAGFMLVKKANTIDKMFTDNKGYIWVTVFGEGLLKIDPATNKVVATISQSNPKGYNLWNNVPKDIIQYNDSQLVVASGALNIINTNTYRVTHISTHEGLPNNTALSVVKDAAGVLWLGTLNGLCRADLDKHSFAVYDQSDGLLNENFNGTGAFALSDGRLLFNTAESFVVFDPAKTRKNTTEQPFITDFKLSNSSLPVDSLLALDHVNLGYNQNSVIFEFSALNYCTQNKLDYYYQLEGLDTTWYRSDDRHQAVYNFLPPGTYHFNVKTKNTNGIYSNNMATFRFVIDPPFWKAWWFYMIVLLLVVLVLYLIDRERMRRLATLHNVRSEIASHLHLDVSTTLNNINVLSQIAKLKADRDIIRSKELIEEIGNKSYNMVVTMDEILWSIDPGNDTMEKTLQRIFEYIETLETKYNAAIDIVVHEKVKDLRLDMKLRHDFLLACKETLQSLAQDTTDKSILIDIDLVRSKIVLKILSIGSENDYDPAALAKLKDSIATKAAAMHASLNFEVSKRETSIVLGIPLKQ